MIDSFNHGAGDLDEWPGKQTFGFRHYHQSVKAPAPWNHGIKSSLPAQGDGKRPRLFQRRIRRNRERAR